MITRRLILGLVWSAGLVAGQGVVKKRAVPAAPKPVTIGAVRYEVVLGGRPRGLPQDGGVIRAVARDSGAELWTLVVYKIRFDPGMETDKQEVYITKLKRSGSGLRVENERGGRYRVDLAKQTTEVLRAPR